MDPASWVIAGASAVTALATAMLAWVGRGTWKLYELERGQRAAIRARFASRVHIAQKNFGGLLRAAERRIGDPDALERANQTLLPRLTREAERAGGVVGELVSEASAFPMEVMATLDVAEFKIRNELVPGAEYLLQNWLHMQPDEREQRFGRMKDELAVIQELLEAAWRAIPEEDRRWGPEEDTRSYGELLEEVTERTRHLSPRE